MELSIKLIAHILTSLALGSATVSAAALDKTSGATTLVASTTIHDAPATTGTYVTSLERSGNPTSAPFPTTQAAVSTASPSALSRPASVKQFVALASNVNPFVAVATDAPPSQVPSKGGHPVSTGNITPANAQSTTNYALHTNKFYANMFLGSQSNGIFTHPYVLTWAKGANQQTKSWGMVVTHSDASLKGYGPTHTEIPGSPAQYYLNPLGIQSLILSANELGSGTVLTANSLDTFSANAVLRPSSSSSSSITIPVVQGMGFATGIYKSLQPQIQSGVSFQKVTYIGSVSTGIYKWQVNLNDGTFWLMYVTPNSDTGTAPTFTLSSNYLLQGPANFNGVIQVAKNSAGQNGESTYDKSAGIYPTKAKLTGSTNGGSGSYTLTWTLAGKQNGQQLLQYALPHHINSFDSATKGRVISGMSLVTTVKGVANAIVSNNWTMTENLPTTLGFAPWTRSSGSVTKLSSTAVNAIYKAAQLELQQDIIGQSNQSSMYYSGKALSKFAFIIYATNDLCNAPDLAQKGLATLKNALNIFISNSQQFPLYYDTVWRGVVSSASYNGGDPNADFGNTYYNDHHFHYGYFLHTAAVIGHLDSTWLSNSTNKAWVNMLARDVSNPSSSDLYFPVFRNFDWYYGHSLAKGLFESADGKDEESSSEDVMFAYGLKLWGNVIGDASMEARGNLMLAVLARSLQSYFLMESSNTNEPSQFIANKAPGITFENKVDHTTYFGTNFEYIEGIHMLPLTPASVFTRTSNFVTEEWRSYFAPGAVDDASKVAGGWKGILYANLAIINATASFNFFNNASFDNSWLDGGASKTWYLAFAAGLGGA